MRKMKITFIILVFIATCGLIYGYPTSSEESEHLLIDTEFINEDYVDENGHKIVKKSVEHGSKEKNDNEELQEPCRLTLPVFDVTRVNELSETDNKENGKETQDARTISDVQYLPYEDIPYRFDYTQEFPEDFNLISYRMPEEFMNRFPPVRSLPPVYSAKIYEMIPNDFDKNVYYERDNSFNFAPNVRAIRSEEEDLLAELEKDSVMPNILPTLPFPYMRDAGSYVPIQNQQYAAMYPVDSNSDCALPFLLTCNPQVNYGTIEYANNPSGYTSASYKNVDFDQML